MATDESGKRAWKVGAQIFWNRSMEERPTEDRVHNKNKNRDGRMPPLPSYWKASHCTGPAPLLAADALAAFFSAERVFMLGPCMLRPALTLLLCTWSL